MRKLTWIVVFAIAALQAAAAGAAAEADSGGKHPANFDWSEFILPPTAEAATAARSGFAAFSEALANESPLEAEVLAKQMVELASTDTRESIERARALQNLAVAQQLLGEYESAGQNYLASIAAVSHARDNLSPDLVAPLRGLAASFIDSQQTEKAFAALDRALHISNVDFGPHCLEQLPILRTRMRLFLDLEDRESALEVLDRMYSLYTRQYERYSEEMLPALYQRARTFNELDILGEEARAWRHILEIKERYLADDDPELIEPNIQLASIYVSSMRSNSFRSVSSSSAERHLKTALRIAETSPEANWEVRKDCLLSLADFYTVFDLKARARRFYGEAWDLLSSDDAWLAARADSFGSPVPLARPSPDRYANIEVLSDYEEYTDDDYLEGEVTVRFDVDDRGRTQDLQVVAATPEKFTRMEIRARNAVEQFIYRPRFVDGEPVNTADLEYRFRYFYLPSVYESALEKSEKHNRAGRQH